MRCFAYLQLIHGSFQSLVNLHWNSIHNRAWKECLQFTVSPGRMHSQTQRSVSEQPWPAGPAPHSHTVLKLCQDFTCIQHDVMLLLLPKRCDLLQEISALLLLSSQLLPQIFSVLLHLGHGRGHESDLRRISECGH